MSDLTMYLLKLMPYSKANYEFLFLSWFRGQNRIRHNFTNWIYVVNRFFLSLSTIAFVSNRILKHYILSVGITWRSQQSEQTHWVSRRSSRKPRWNPQSSGKNGSHNNFLELSQKSVLTCKTATWPTSSLKTTRQNQYERQIEEETQLQARDRCIRNQEKRKKESSWIISVLHSII